MIRLRIDVDYPYPSRAESFICTALGMPASVKYLRNAKIIARMINESPRKIEAFWFFTSRTTPDKKMIELLSSDRHCIGPHIINDPYEEMAWLEKITIKSAKYYTVHGTERFLARLIWRRRRQTVEIPEGYPLKSFYTFPTLHLDRVCYEHTAEESIRAAEESIAKGEIIHIHPIWLFQRGRINPRGPYYITLRRILNADKNIENLAIRKKGFFRIANNRQEYDVDVQPTETYLEKLQERELDIFTFVERRWCCPVMKVPDWWVWTPDNVALIQMSTYTLWLRQVGKKTRNMIRKAVKSGIQTMVVEPDRCLARGIWQIYNETPIRQERGFPHYGTALDSVEQMVASAKDTTFIGAYHGTTLAGFMQIVHGRETARIAQILSLQEYWNKGVNNALVAKGVEMCTDKDIRWLIYGRMGNHPTLDNFKKNNGGIEFPVRRYYVPLSRKGRIAIALGLHRELKDTLPQSTKHMLFPVYNWLSRAKMKARLWFRNKKTTVLS